MDGDDVRVIERGKRLGFAREPRPTVGVVAELRRQDLERDLAASRVMRYWPGLRPRVEIET
jgi:hypothetical protein